MADIFYQPKSRMFSNDGLIGAGYKFYFYQTGTTTPITTYSDVNLTIANTNPVIADSYGYFNLIYVSDFSQVKVIVKDSDDNLIYTADPVNPSGSSSITLNDLGVRPTSYWGLTAGTASAYTLSANPTLSAYSNYNTFFIQFNVACNAAPTLSVDGLGAKSLKKYTGQGTKVALQAGDVQASQRYICVYDGVDFVVLNPRSLPLQSGSTSSLTIAVGVITITNDSSSYTIDTESSAATDDLDTINGGNDGEIIYIKSTSDARNVVVKHNTGNIYNPQNNNISTKDITLDLTTDFVVLRYNSSASKWIVLSSSLNQVPNITLGTVTSASGTSVNFTGIPSWAKSVVVMFNGVSTNGTSRVMVQLGTSGTPTTTGYNGAIDEGVTFTTGFLLGGTQAVDTRSGQMIINNFNANIWTESSANWTGGGFVWFGAGLISLSGTLDMIRVTTVNGTDTFDAGTINIQYS